MSLRRKLAERVAGTTEEPGVVEIRVPQESSEDIIKAAGAFGHVVQKLVDDKADLQNAVEFDRREIQALRERLRMVENDREYDRHQARMFAQANGRLAATITWMRQGLEAMADTIAETQAAVDQMPTPPPVSGEPRSDNGGAPMPTLEEIAERCAPAK